MFQIQKFLSKSDIDFAQGLLGLGIGLGLKALLGEIILHHLTPGCMLYLKLI